MVVDVKLDPNLNYAMEIVLFHPSSLQMVFFLLSKNAPMQFSLAFCYPWPPFSTNQEGAHQKIEDSDVLVSCF